MTLFFPLKPSFQTKIIGTPASIGSNTVASSSSATFTTTANIVAGDLVVVSIGYNSTGTISSVSDGTNSYTKALGTKASNGGFEIWYKSNASAVSSGATLTFTASASLSQAAYGGARVTGATALDIAVTDVTQSNSSTVATGTLTDPVEILWGGAGGFNITAFTEDASFTNIFNLQQSTSQVWGSLGYKKVSSTSTSSYAPTTTGTIGSKIIGITGFK